MTSPDPGAMPQPQPLPRRTRQQQAMADVLSAQDEFRSAQQIHDDLRGLGESIGLATVYRNLQALAERGEVDSLRSGAGEVLYRRCSTLQHHHHLVCRSCGRTVEVSGGDVEAWLDRMAEDHGFSELRHDLEIFGTCAACSAPAPA